MSSEPDDVILKHVEAQRAWYDGNAERTMHWYQRLRTVSLAATVLIPFTLLVPLPGLTSKLIAGAFGVVAAFCQGFEGIHQYREHYIAWRFTAEQIERQQFEYTARIGEYATASNPARLLATKVETITSQENQQWLSLAEKPPATSD